MIILKILNNNMVISRNSSGNEIILRGKGVGFQKRKGEEVSEQQIERIFLPLNEQESKYFQELVAQMPMQYLTLTEDIIKYAREVLNLDITDRIVLPLFDHIVGSVDRFKNGVKINNPMLWDIQRLYPKEFKVGLKAVELIKDTFSIEAGKDEAAFLAYHFVNNQLNTVQNTGDINSVTKLINEIIKIIELCYQIRLDEAEWNFQRLVTHLKFFAQRLLNKTQQSDESDEFFHLVKNSKPRVYKCMIKIADFLHDEYGYELNKEEMLYLMLHIERVTREYT